MLESSVGALKAVEDFIFGRGDWLYFGTGIISHPNGDANQKRIHDACLTLESRGRITRHLEDEFSVTWKPIQPKADQCNSSDT